MTRTCLDDCPLCALEDERYDLIAPIPEHDDARSFELAQMGTQYVGTQCPKNPCETCVQIWAPSWAPSTTIKR
jgi:hypothetical protein